MKRLVAIILITVCTLLYSQDFQVSNSGGYSVDIPHLAVSGSKVHLIHGTNFNYYKFNDDGSNLPVSSKIPADNYGPNSVDIAVDHQDSNHIAVAYYDFHYDQSTGTQFYGCYMTESLDGGLTFDTPTLLDTIQYGNTLSNMQYDMPKIAFLHDEYSSLYALWRVDANKVDTNALWLGSRFGSRNRMDNKNNNNLELAIGMTAETEILVSFGVMEDGHAKFYIGDVNEPILVKDDGQTFINNDHFTKVFYVYGGKYSYIFNDFAHPAKLIESNGTNNSIWEDKGLIDNHNYTYLQITRFLPTAENYNYYSGLYYVKLLKDDNNNLVYYISSDLMNWQNGGQINSDSAQISGMTSYFVDAKINDKNHTLVTAWIDSRTGNEEIFYSRINLPNLVSVDDNLITPLNFNLAQNYPNPFNPSTTINYKLGENSQVSLSVYDLLGNEIKTLVDESQTAGEYSINFDGAKLSSGIYIYKLATEKFISSKKMILIK